MPLIASPTFHDIHWRIIDASANVKYVVYFASKVKLKEDASNSEFFIMINDSYGKFYGAQILLFCVFITFWWRGMSISRILTFCHYNFHKSHPWDGKCWMHIFLSDFFKHSLLKKFLLRLNYMGKKGKNTQSFKRTHGFFPFGNTASRCECDHISTFVFSSL